MPLTRADPATRTLDRRCRRSCTVRSRHHRPSTPTAPATSSCRPGCRTPTTILLNPVVLWAHNRSQFPPIGTCEWLDVQPRRIVAETRFAAGRAVRRGRVPALRAGRPARLVDRVRAAAGEARGRAATARRACASRSGTCSNTRRCRSRRTRRADGRASQKGLVRDPTLRDWLAPRAGRPRRPTGAASATCSSESARRDAVHSRVDSRAPVFLCADVGPILVPISKRCSHVHTQSTTDKFQSRDELVSVHRGSRPPRPSRRRDAASSGACRGSTAGPVGQDSAGYCVLKAAAFALGYVGPDQAKEEIHSHQQLRDLYAGYGFVPHHGQQSFLVPLASAHLPAFEPQGRRLRDELHQKMTAHADKFDPDEADWIGRRAGLPHRRRSARSATPPAGRWCRCRCSAN